MLASLFPFDLCIKRGLDLKHHTSILDFFIDALTGEETDDEGGLCTGWVAEKRQG